MTDRAVAKLQALVRIPTVSNLDPARIDTDVFDAFLAELERQFPCSTSASSSRACTPTASSSAGRVATPAGRSC